MFRNLHLKIFALCLSIVFWIFVVSIKNVFATVPQEIPISPVNVAESLALASGLPSVAVTVRSENADLFRKLAVEDFKATVDLKDAGAGEHVFPVFVVSKRSDIRIVRVEPETVSLILEPIREEIVRLEVEHEGTSKEGYVVTGFKASQDFIRVRGAESALRVIKSALAVVVLSGEEDANVRRKASVRVKNESGQDMTNIDILQDSVFVDITIEQGKTQKHIPVLVNLKGRVPQGGIGKLLVEPLAVLAEGEREILEEIFYLRTEPVLIQDFANGGTLKKRLVIPSGISLLNLSENEVAITLEIAP